MTVVSDIDSIAEIFEVFRGYELANIIIFVIIEPALIILYFVLWIRQRVLIKELMIQSTNTYLAVNKKSKLH